MVCGLCGGVDFVEYVEKYVKVQKKKRKFFSDSAILRNAKKVFIKKRGLL